MMDVDERRTRIGQIVSEHGEAAFASLAADFGVSEMTIRRDVEALEKAGLVRRIFGGVIAGSGMGLEPPYGQRAGREVGSKDRIGAAIADALRPGETVFLDSGSTVAAVAHALQGRDLGLTVLTPSIQVAVALADEPGTRVILLGGEVRAGELSIIGHDAEQMLARYNCDTFVAGVAGVDPVKGLTEYHPQEASIKRAAVARSARVIVGADSTKLGQVFLVTVAALDQVAMLVTDSSDHPTLAAAREAGASVITVSDGNPPYLNGNEQ
ncbi:DeoR/GlpR family DNA-binding transcription regulator [Demequina aurantiaca]|uniref:DeoR/GlpR family DNA-binding transcription regulator n=1 Tax=Demequina aurantiaca TaxID=676200 RepID=UPI003D3450C7